MTRDELDEYIKEFGLDKIEAIRIEPNGKCHVTPYLRKILPPITITNEDTENGNG